MSDDRDREAPPYPTPTARRERRAALVTALRSGEFNQTFGALRDVVGFCCLGVAEHVRDPRCWSLSDEDGAPTDYHIRRFVGVLLSTGERSSAESEVTNTVLSSDTAWWYGWREDDPAVTWRRSADDAWTWTSMTDLNDTMHLSFAAIADVLADQPDDWDGTLGFAQDEAERRNAAAGELEVTS